MPSRTPEDDTDVGWLGVIIACLVVFGLIATALAAWKGY